MPVFEFSPLPDGVTWAPSGAEPKKESLLTLTGPHMVVKPGSTVIHPPSVITPAGPAKEILRPGTNPADKVTRVLVGPHTVVETLPTVLSEEEVKIMELHESGQKMGTMLWHTDYEAALNPKHDRFQQYNRLDLYDDGRMVITEIKPGEIFSDTVYIEPGKVAEVREYIKAHGFNWIPKQQGYLKEGTDITAYRAITSTYNPATDEATLKAMMDPDGGKRGGAVYAFDREAQLLSDDSLRIRLQGSHRAPVDKTGAYKIDDIPSIIRK